MGRMLFALRLLTSTMMSSASTGRHPRVGYTTSNARGTMWGDRTDAGGCQMPKTGYRVQHAIALGDHEAMGLLTAQKSNQLCGQGVSVHCGGRAVDAVVASVCNKNAHNCGVDMIRKTWSEATGGRSPGVAKCRVTLKNTLPMTSRSPKCFYRPRSPTNNAYYASVGLFNTGGRLPVSAKLGNIRGRFNGVSSYFDFRGHVGIHTHSRAKLTVKFSDGSSTSVPFRSCTPSGGAYIWMSRGGLRR
jgi:hypothetical protein